MSEKTKICEHCGGELFTNEEGEWRHKDGPWFISYASNCDVLQIRKLKAELAAAKEENARLRTDNRQLRNSVPFDEAIRKDLEEAVLEIAKERDAVKEQLEAHSWDISPAMVHAKIEQLNAANDALRARLTELAAIATALSEKVEWLKSRDDKEADQLQSRLAKWKEGA